VISTIGDFVDNSYLWTHKGTDSTLLTEVEEDGRFPVNEADDIYRTLPNAHAASGALVHVNPWKHIDFSFFG
jgi:hypothetical protein